LSVRHSTRELPTATAAADAATARAKAIVHDPKAAASSGAVSRRNAVGPGPGTGMGGQLVRDIAAEYEATPAESEPLTGVSSNSGRVRDMAAQVEEMQVRNAKDCMRLRGAL
jgi:hypothetical protein